VARFPALSNAGMVSEAALTGPRRAEVSLTGRRAVRTLKISCSRCPAKSVLLAPRRAEMPFTGGGDARTPKCARSRRPAEGALRGAEGVLLLLAFLRAGCAEAARSLPGRTESGL
jgi:hypothetical protein